MAKQDVFQGKPIEELRALSREEFAKLVPSRNRRHMLRENNPQFDERIALANRESEKGKEPRAIRTHLRETIIDPRMVGLTFGVYNGHEFTPVRVTLKMLGHRLGEFALTRKRLSHGKAGIGATKSSTAITARG
ncbi:MAG: ribosomal protein S19 family protein [Candidatus Diapherotrites archaeon]|nr:ribosomal protein S19 family protein [Candidatus Diapherotrites archaeon]